MRMPGAPFAECENSIQDVSDRQEACGEEEYFYCFFVVPNGRPVSANRAGEWLLLGVSLNG